MPLASQNAYNTQQKIGLELLVNEAILAQKADLAHLYFLFTLLKSAAYRN